MPEQVEAVRSEALGRPKEISAPSMALLRDLEFTPQVVGYDHRIAELDKARLIKWESGLGYIASEAGLALLKAGAAQ